MSREERRCSLRRRFRLRSFELVMLVLGFLIFATAFIGVLENSSAP